MAEDDDKTNLDEQETLFPDTTVNITRNPQGWMFLVEYKDTI